MPEPVGRQRYAARTQSPRRISLGSSRRVCRSGLPPEGARPTHCSYYIYQGISAKSIILNAQETVFAAPGPPRSSWKKPEGRRSHAGSATSASGDSRRRIRARSRDDRRGADCPTRWDPTQLLQDDKSPAVPHASRWTCPRGVALSVTPRPFVKMHLRKRIPKRLRRPAHDDVSVRHLQSGAQNTRL